MRIGCLQFAPLVGDVDNNLNRADAVLSKADIEELDLLVLPELAFTGYNFRSLQQIAPFLEHAGSGITSLWARTAALKYNCVVAAGYPEKVDITNRWPTGPEYYNSTILVNGDGETIGNYRKSFLYHVDETWALEGPDGFFDSWIPGLGNTSIGICMDLNPYKFEAPWDAFEFAFHVQEVESNLVIVTMAWMTREDPRHLQTPQEPDMDTLTYWVTRLEPLIRSESPEEIIVVFCNRTGHEAEATYAGTSAVLGIKLGEVRVYGVLGRGQKQLLVVDTNTTPYAKLVYSSDTKSIVNVASNVTSDSNSPESLSLPLSKIPDLKRYSHDSRRDLSTEVIESVEVWAGNVAQQKEDLKTTYTTPPNDATPPQTATTPPTQNLAYVTTELREEGAEQHAVSQPNNSSTSIQSPKVTSPAAIRPKLIIPQSPQMLPNYFSPNDPTSALSTFSQQSLQSIKSNDSKLSVQTVVSNPRPPEDSTPYPLSGAPLSGYPTNSFHGTSSKAQKFIYAGYLSIAQGDNPSLETPLGEMTPLSPQWYWRVGDDDMVTPISASVWPTATPIGRHAEPFLWPITTAIPTAAGNADSLDQDVKDQTPKTANKTDSEAFTSLKITSVANSPEPSVTMTPAEKLPQALSRPSSPKSRNASRSRMHARSSSVSKRDISLAGAEQFKSFSQDTKTLGNRRQSMVDLATASKQPLLGTRARSHSQHRHVHVAATNSQQSGNMSQTLFPDRAVPTKLTNQYYRDGSDSIEVGEATTRRSESVAISAHRHIASETPARAFSRGRQPGPAAVSDLNGNIPKAKRSTSADSTRNDILHRRVSSKTGSRREGTPKRHSSRSQTPRQRRISVQETTEFERVEEIPCPNCPVHGARSNSAHSTPKKDPNRSRQPSSSSRRRSSSRRQWTRDATGNYTGNPSPGLYRQASSSHLASTRRSMTPPPRSTTAPIPTESFDPTDPTTPKAMTFGQVERLNNVEDLYLQPTTYNPNAPLRGFRTTRYDNFSHRPTA